MEEMGDRSIEDGGGASGEAPQGLPSASTWSDVGHQLEQSEMTGRRLSQSSDLSSESESTCTVLQRETRPESVQKFEDREQILSAGTLAASLSEVKSDSTTGEPNETRELVEIDLNESLVVVVGGEQTQDENENTMYHHHTQHGSGQQQTAGIYRVSQQPQNDTSDQPHHFRGFGEAPPKISFASRRMKEYFESFKGHGNETRRLYQFFKSIRTELVACFLFTLITSQALITCRTQLSSSGGQSQPSPSWWSTATQEPPAPTTSLVVQLDGPNRKYPLNVHLAQGAMVAFTVASLTQVFGHISGCHLIPSVSLALYVKGHISKGRLASYLAAQTVGSAMGVSLLSVLTSSQLTPAEFRQSLETVRARRANHQLQVVSSVVPQASPLSPSMFLSGDRLRRRRKRRDTSNQPTEGGGPLQAPSPDSNPSEPLEGSETILLAIMEQQQELLGSKLRRHSPATTIATTTSEPTSRGELGKTITANGSTYSGLGAGVSTVPAPSDREFSLASPADRAEPTWLPSSPSTPPNSNDRSRSSADSPSQRTLASLPQQLQQQQQQQRQYQQQQQWRQQQQQSDYQRQTETAPSDFRAPAAEPGGRLIRRRMKRNRQPSAEANTAVGATTNDAGYYINLLEFGLPEQIMSSESIRQCIDKQLAGGAGGQVNLSELASRGFSHCLSLSNSSQMFVFQFLATLLVVLTYLVNVDPRRVDVGFKSLSIGLAYFVAGLVTVQSGGFFGNPFQLTFLSWLSPTGEWQTEWFIYLATPLIGGLFGAISHEYIDFTSPRNRNKQLHLRRSFYSLDNLAVEGNAAAAASEANNAQTMMLSSTSSTNYGHHHHHHHHQNPMLQSGLEPATEMAPAVMSAPLVPAARRSRDTSADSSSSLESASSSILSLNTNAVNLNDNPAHQPHQHRQQPQQAQAPTTAPKTPKKPNYAKQLKLEHQQQLKATPSRNLCAPSEVTASSKSGQRMSLRRSDFDSNFLISSSSPTANPRNLFHQNQHQLQQGQITSTSTSGWM